MLVRDYIAALDRMPIVSLDELLGPGAVVVLAPHPDDETLGCGGMIAMAAASGRPVSVVILTDGSGSHPGSLAVPPRQLAAIRRDEARAAVGRLGLPAHSLIFLDCPDTAAPHAGPAFDRVVDAMSAVVERNRAGTLFVSWEHDPHCDHEAAALVARAVASRHPGLKLWRYPIWGLHRPPEQAIDVASPRGMRLDIAVALPAKLDATECHASQLGRVVRDDSSGFQLTPAMLAPFRTPFERFIGD